MFADALSVLLSPPVAPPPGHRMLYLELFKRYKRLTLPAQATVPRRDGPGVGLEIAGVDDAPELEAAVARLGLLPPGLVAAGPWRGAARAGSCGRLRASELRPSTM